LADADDQPIELVDWYVSRLVAAPRHEPQYDRAMPVQFGSSPPIQLRNPAVVVAMPVFVEARYFHRAHSRSSVRYAENSASASLQSLRRLLWCSLVAVYT
jgi:hypothetical protein